MNNLEQIIHEEIKAFLDEKKKKKKKKKAKKKKGDRCTRIAKRKYDVWPSAYASGAVVRCRRGEIWKGIKEGEEKFGKSESRGHLVQEYVQREMIVRKLRVKIHPKGKQVDGTS